MIWNGLEMAAWYIWSVFALRYAKVLTKFLHAILPIVHSSFCRISCFCAVRNVNLLVVFLVKNFTHSDQCWFFWLLTTWAFLPGFKPNIHCQIWNTEYSVIIIMNHEFWLNRFWMGFLFLAEKSTHIHTHTQLLLLLLFGCRWFSLVLNANILLLSYLHRANVNMNMCEKWPSCNEQLPHW